VKQEYAAKDMAYNFSEKTRATFESLLERLSTAHNIYEAIAMKTESDRLKTRLFGEIANEAARRTSAMSIREKQDTPPLPRKVKTVSVKTLFAGSPQASSVEEVDIIVKSVRQELIAQLEDGTTIQIAKGGENRNWYGNNDYVVNWENDGVEIQNFKDEVTGRIRSHNYNLDYIFSSAITGGAICLTNFQRPQISATSFTLLKPLAKRPLPR
jgi:hypothetical protein